jgi:hypothetical protein
MESPQRPLRGAQQGQEQQQQPPTTYARAALDRALWNLTADGAMTHRGAHVTEKQLQHLVDGVMAADDNTEARQWLDRELADHGIVLQGELPGTILTGHVRRQVRLIHFVRAVRHGR